MTTVRVPQQDGEIKITVGGNEPLTYPVKNGRVTVEPADLSTFLASVDNATVEEGNEAQSPQSGETKERSDGRSARSSTPQRH